MKKFINNSYKSCKLIYFSIQTEWFIYKKYNKTTQVFDVNQNPSGNKIVDIFSEQNVAKISNV